MARQQQLTSLLGRELYLTSFFQVVPPDERFAHAASASQKAVVAQDHHVLVFQICDQALLLIEIQGNPFIVVIGDLAVELHGHLVHGQ